MTLGKKVQGGVECLYESNLLHHVGVVAKRVCAAAHEGDDITPSGPMGRGVKTDIPNIVTPHYFLYSFLDARNLPDRHNIIILPH